jgi:hypothetical protein
MHVYNLPSSDTSLLIPNREIHEHSITTATILLSHGLLKYDVAKRCLFSKDLIRGCIQKFPDWLPGAKTANGSEFSWHTLCVASQRVFIVVNVYFVIDSVLKLLDTSLESYIKCRHRLRSLHDCYIGIIGMRKIENTAVARFLCE